MVCSVLCGGGGEEMKVLEEQRSSPGARAMGYGRA